MVPFHIRGVKSGILPVVRRMARPLLLLLLLNFNPQTQCLNVVVSSWGGLNFNPKPKTLFRPVRCIV